MFTHIYAGKGKSVSKKVKFIINLFILLIFIIEYLAEIKSKKITQILIKTIHSLNNIILVKFHFINLLNDIFFYFEKL